MKCILKKDHRSFTIRKKQWKERCKSVKRNQLALHHPEVHCSSNHWMVLQKAKRAICH